MKENQPDLKKQRRDIFKEIEEAKEEKRFRLKKRLFKDFC